VLSSHSGVLYSNKNEQSPTAYNREGKSHSQKSESKIVETTAINTRHKRKQSTMLLEVKTVFILCGIVTPPPNKKQKGGF
jgi:hypothetical protein